MKEKISIVYVFFLILKVKVSIYKLGSEVAYFIFDGRRSDRFSWFNKTRLITTSYNRTVIMNEEQNFFSIHGYSFIKGTFRSYRFAIKIVLTKHEGFLCFLA